MTDQTDNAARNADDAMSEAVAWLVEEDAGGVIHYAALRSDLRWPAIRVERRLSEDYDLEKYETPIERVKDVNLALRFARKQDAEAFIALFDKFLLHAAATEHMWPALAADMVEAWVGVDGKATLAEGRRAWHRLMYPTKDDFLGDSHVLSSELILDVADRLRETLDVLDAALAPPASGEVRCGDGVQLCDACSVPAHELTQTPGCGGPLNEPASGVTEGVTQADMDRAADLIEAYYQDKSMLKLAADFRAGHRFGPWPATFAAHRQTARNDALLWAAAFVRAWNGETRDGDTFLIADELEAATKGGTGA